MLKKTMRLRRKGQRKPYQSVQLITCFPQLGHQRGVGLMSDLWSQNWSVTFLRVFFSLYYGAVVSFFTATVIKFKKSEVITVTGRGGLQGCKILMIPLFLVNGLTYGGKDVSLTHLPRSAPQKLFLCMVLFSVRDWTNPRAYCDWTE
jgi:hypothetical protein